MIKFLRRNQQAFILFIFLYGITLIVSFYFTHTYRQLITSPFKMPFISGIIRNSLLNQNTYFLLTLLVALVLFFIGFYFTRIIIKFLIIPSRSQFPALFFLVISAFAFPGDFFSGAVPASLLLLISMERLFDSVDQNGLSFRFFDSGILLGLASLFYFNILFLFPFFMLTQLVLRPPRWRELLFIFIGMSIPFLYIFSTYFLKGISIHDTWQQIMDWIYLRKIVTINRYFLAGIVFYLFVLIICSLFALRKFATTKILSRKYYQLLFSLFINLLFIYILIPSAGSEIFYLYAIPASVPLSMFFNQCRNTLFNNFILLILLAIPISLFFL